MNNKGFTLMELIVTVAIIAVLAGLAFFNSGSMRNGYTIRAAARQVYGDLQKVRMKAIKEGKRLKVDFDGTTGAYSLDIVDSDGALIETFMNCDLKGNYPAVEICKADDIIFNPNGSASTDGIYMRLGDRVKRVYVSSSGTGNIRIRDESCP